MGFWGWRQGAYAVFISVLVTACVPAHHTALSPTLTPLTVTLTVVKPPGLSATPRAPRILTATPAHHPVTLDILPPHCDELLNGHVQCVGVLRNTTAEAAAWVVIHADGAGFAYFSTAIEQRLVPAGTDAPYRLLFDAPAETLILSLESMVAEHGWVMLDILEDNGQQTPSSYQVTAQLVNPSAVTLTDGRAVIMVFDGDVLLRYRVIEFDDLNAGQSIRLDEIWHGVTGDNLRHTISVIAWEV